MDQVATTRLLVSIELHVWFHGKTLRKKNKRLEDRLLDEQIKNGKVIDEYNDLADSYNNLLEQNQEKEKRVKPFV